ncbi:MAG: tetratricopeptide repeat protein [Polyangiales bacterium]|nr:tetratricopeptide repeat protein [Myxococcales bacterium]MCB9661631.1 tetratricopeptide repeat protein [Sandaracinaceae bacterium]
MSPGLAHLSLALWLCAAPLAAQSAGGDEADEPSAHAADDARAREADDARARELYVLGDEFYANGRYEAAEEAFAEAYRLSGRPLLLFNLANAQERSGRWREAAENLRRYRASAPPSEYAALDARLGALVRRIAERDAESLNEPVVVVQHESSDLPRGTPPSFPPRAPLRPERLLLPTAGTLGVVTFVLALRVRAARDDVRAACVSHSGQRLCLPEARRPIAQDRRLSLATDLLAVATLTTTALGLWQLVRSRRAPSVDDRTLRVGASRTGFQLSLEGAF